MVRRLGRLPFLRRQRDPSQSVSRAVDDAPLDPDSAPLGPPILLPATIFRQVLVDETELTPDWARPRAATASTDKPPATKRARKPKAANAPAANSAAPGTKRSPSTRKRTNSA